MDRARFLVSLAGLVLAATAVRAEGPRAEAAPKPPPIERRPYAIRAAFAIDPALRIDQAGRERLVNDWRGLVRRFVGAPWDLDIRAAEGRLARMAPEALTAADFTSLGAGADCAWLVHLGAAEHGGHQLSGRAFDVQTETLGPLMARPAPFPSDLPRALLGLSLDLFNPIAEIGPSVAGGVTLTVQAGAIPAASPTGAVVAPGTVFIPIRLLFGPDGQRTRILPVGWSYLTVESVEGPIARCAILSGLRDPLTRRVAGKSRLVAIGARAAPEPMRFRFETRPPNPQPAAGALLTARDAPDAVPKELGTTDREGRIVVPAGFAQKPVILRLLAGGIEPLVEFPVMPGETAEERLIKINPLPQAVALETKLHALRDEVVDLVAVRSRLQARLESRSEGNAWDEVRALLDEYLKLPARQVYLDRVEKARADATEQQARLKVPVLTRTAQALLQDTESLIGRYLDDEMFQAYERAYGEAMKGGVRAPSEDWKPFSPPGASYQVLIPGRPVPVPPPATSDAEGTRDLQFFGTNHKGAVYSVGTGTLITDGPLIGAAGTQQALERIRDAINKQSGVILLDQKPVSVDGIAGMELRLELPQKANESTPPVQRMRTFLTTGGKLTRAVYTGTKASADGPEAETFLRSLRFQLTPAPRTRPATTAPQPTAAPAAPKPAAPKPAAPKPGRVVPF